jgi:(+)-trans-carveol dehydrogenase
MGRIEGKVALITGGARGQGRSHAIRLAEEGARIVVTDICGQIDTVPYPMATEEDLAETVRQVEALDQPCLAIKADARDQAAMEAAVQEAVDRFGRIDVLAVNHGVAMVKGWDEWTPQEWKDMLDTDLLSVWISTRAALPHMIENGGGSVVITASASGLQSQLGLLPYMAAKWGVVGLTKSLAAEMAEHWVRVNAVCPTNVASPMLHNEAVITLFNGGREDSTIEDMKFPATATNLLPIPWVEPVDISNAVLFLASDEARYITGFAMPVDAGMSNQTPGIPPIAGKRLAELAQAVEG